MGIIKYHNAFHYLCFKNCVYQILTIYNIDFPLKYMRYDVDFSIDLSKIDHDIFVKKSNLEAVLSSIKLEFYFYDDGNKAWKDNKNILDRNCPYIAIVDVYYLYYRKEYLKCHGAHSIIVKGYDSENKIIEIIDWYEPYYFFGYINEIDFFKSTNSENPYSNNPFSGFPIKNETVYVSNVVNDKSIKECILENLNLIFIESRNENLISKETSIIYLINIIKNSVECKEQFFKKLYDDLFSINNNLNLFYYILNESNLTYFTEKFKNQFINFQKQLSLIMYICLKLSIKTNEILINKIISLLEKFRKLIINFYKMLFEIKLLLEKENI